MWEFPAAKLVLKTQFMITDIFQMLPWTKNPQHNKKKQFINEYLP